MTLAERITLTQPAKDEVAIYFLGQAGFCLKTPVGTVLAVDPYLSNFCLKAFGFKRMTPSVIRPDELVPDIMLFTHRHGDHLDPEALPFFVGNGKTFFIAAADCREALDRESLPQKRRKELHIGEEVEMHGVCIRSVYADHGPLAPEAVGYELNTGELRIYITGDTGFCPEKILSSLGGSPDIMIAPINGAYGNLSGEEANQLALRIKPKILIGCHTGMFIEHGGDPEKFLSTAKRLKVALAFVMAPGEELIYNATTGLCRQAVPDSPGSSFYELSIKLKKEK